MGGALSFVNIEACYRNMAADQAREQEALDWPEGVIVDSSLPQHEHGSDNKANS